MQTVKITFACGHQGEEKIRSKKDAEYKQAAAAKKVCPECYARQKEQARAAENQAAATWAKAQGLPALKGTEKQVTWAEAIRKKAFDTLDLLEDAVRAHFSNNKFDESDLTIALRLISALREMYRHEHDARFFIDYRDKIDKLHINVHGDVRVFDYHLADLADLYQRRGGDLDALTEE